MNAPRQLPHRPKAEDALLGGILLRGVAGLRSVMHCLQIEDLYQPRAQAVYRAMRLLEEREQPLDVVTIETQLRRTGELELVGGIEGLARLDRYATAQNLDAHALIIRQAAQTRRAAVLGRELHETLMVECEDDVGPMLRKRAAELADIADYGAVRGAGWSSREVAAQVHAGIAKRLRGGQTVGLGFPGLDALTCTEEGDCVVLAGRPSMGKTAMAASIVREAVFERIPGQPWAWRPKPNPTPVFFCSAEMTPDLVMLRMVGDLTCIDTRALRKPSHALINERGKDIYEALGMLRDAPITWVPHKHARDLDEVEGYHRRWKSRTGKPGIGVVDHLTELRTKAKFDRHDLLVGDMMQRLKDLGKDGGDVMLVLVQLNRQVNAREDHRPRDSDLREAGKIEEVADAIVLLYRECRYPPPKGVKWPGGIERPDELEELLAGLRMTASHGLLTDEQTEQLREVRALRSRVDWIVAKARNGAIGTVRGLFVPEFCSFRSLPAQG